MTPAIHAANLQKILDEAYRLAKLHQTTYMIVEKGIGEYDCFDEKTIDIALRNKACIKVFSFGVFTSMR